jgi:adenylate kinase family enzyme
VNKEEWIIDGNYKAVREITLSKADFCIILQYPKLLIFFRLLWRSLKRIILKEKICNGNYETFYETFFSKNSVLYYQIFFYDKLYQDLNLQLKNYPNLKFIIFKHPNDFDNWFNKIYIENKKK